MSELHVDWRRQHGNCLLMSDGCRLALVIDASKKSTATPLGGVSRIARLIGTPLLPVEELMEPPQATRKTQLTSASEKRKIRDILGPPTIGSAGNTLVRMKARARFYALLTMADKRILAFRRESNLSQC